MTKREFVVEALRKASVLILNSSEKEFSHLPVDERQLVFSEYIKLGENLRIKAIKLGGNFNRFNGRATEKKVKSRAKSDDGRRK